MRYTAILFICLCLFTSRTFAEENDFGLWTFIGVEKSISKTVSLYGEAELRTRDDVKTIDCWALYTEVSVKLCPYLKGGGGYTFIDYNHPTLSWEPRHRLNLFLNGSYSYRNWNFSIRERYEEVHRVLSDKSTPKPIPKRSLRSRLQCSYKIPNTLFAPYATVELYTTLNKHHVGNEKIRYTVGSQISATKHIAFSVYYRYIETFGTHSVDSNILGVGCKFSL